MIGALLGGFNTTKLLALGIVAAIIFTALGGLYWHASNLERKLIDTRSELAVTSAQLEGQKVATQQAANRAQEWADAHVELQAQIRELSNVQRQAAQESGRLRRLVSKHNLAQLALRKPGLIGRRITDGSNDAFRVLNDLTRLDQHPGKAATPATSAARPAPPSTN